MGEKPVSSVGTAEYDGLLVVLREARKRANLTQRALSVKLGRSVTFIDKVERGVRRLDVIEFCLIARALGIDPVDLFRAVINQAAL